MIKNRSGLCGPLFPPPNTLRKARPLNPVKKHLPAIAKISATLALVGVVGLPALPTFAQSRAERVNQITAAIGGAVQTSTRAANVVEQRATPDQLIRKTMTNVDFDAMPVRLALDIWSTQTQVPLVINWASLELAGVNPQTPITLKLRQVPADVVLKLIVGQMQADPLAEDRIIMDIEPWFVRLMTKREAMRQSTTEIYFIGDLLMTIPNFTAAPGFSLNDALSNTNSGGSDGGGNSNEGGLFDTEGTDRAEPEPTKQEKAERIMDLIRSSIEPEIWQANGGQYASVRYLNNMLVVKAPEYVHQQIGVPFRSNTRAVKRSTGNSAVVNSPSKRKVRYKQSGNVAGVRD